jgi:DNA polymerase III gamma/tau subunit
MRDAVSLLELCAGARLPITPELVTRTIGTTGREGTCRVVNAIADKNFDLLFEIIDDMVSASRDPAVFWQELIGYYRDMLVTKTVKDPSRYLDLTDSEKEALIAISAKFTKETLLFHIGLLEDALFAMQKSYAVKRTVCEITLVRLCDPALDTSVESILTRLSRIEEQLVAGIPAVPVETAAPAAAPAAPVATPVDNPSAAEFPVMDEPPLPDMPPEFWEPPMDYGMTEPTPPPVRREAPPPRKETPKPAEAPRPVAEARTSTPAPAPASKPAPVATPAPAATQRVLRPLRQWTEAVDRVKATSRMAASFLISAKAYTTEDGRVVVKLDSTFARDMVAREGAPEALRAALSVCLSRKLDTADILYEVEDNRAKQDGSLIDLIIEAAEE